MSDINDVIEGYVSALLWANTYSNIVDHDGTTELVSYDASGDFELSDFSILDQADILADVANFVRNNEADFTAYCERREYDPSQGTVETYFGHDFLLTRSGHGAGFWDRGLGYLGQRLTDAAHVYGDTMVTVIDGKPVLTS